MSTKSNDYICHKCCKVYKSKGGLCKHIKSKHSGLEKENGSIPCNICDTKYITLISLIHHLRNAHNVCIKFM